MIPEVQRSKSVHALNLTVTGICNHIDRSAQSADIHRNTNLSQQFLQTNGVQINTCETFVIEYGFQPNPCKVKVHSFGTKLNKTVSIIHFYFKNKIPTHVVHTPTNALFNNLVKSFNLH